MLFLTRPSSCKAVAGPPPSADSVVALTSTTHSSYIASSSRTTKDLKDSDLNIVYIPHKQGYGRNFGLCDMSDIQNDGFSLAFSTVS